MNLKVYMNLECRDLRRKNIGDETQIPVDDVQELSKLDALLPAKLGAQRCVIALNAPLSRTQRINPQS
jgi:hypothetical protein